MHALETVEGVAAAVALERVGGVREALQFIEHETRDDEGSAEKAGGADVGEAAFDDDAGIDDDGEVLHV